MSDLIQVVWEFLKLWGLPQLLGVLVYFRIRHYQRFIAYLVGFLLPPLLFFYFAFLFWLYLPAKAHPQTCGMPVLFAWAMVCLGTFISVLVSLIVQLLLLLRRVFLDFVRAR